jgi:hypothetical protein
MDDGHARDRDGPAAFYIFLHCIKRHYLWQALGRPRIRPPRPAARRAAQRQQWFIAVGRLDRPDGSDPTRDSSSASGSASRACGSSQSRACSSSTHWIERTSRMPGGRSHKSFHGSFIPGTRYACGAGEGRRSAGAPTSRTACDETGSGKRRRRRGSTAGSLCAPRCSTHRRFPPSGGLRKEERLMTPDCPEGSILHHASLRPPPPLLASCLRR